ncbi:MAG: hypothetical protein QOK44_4482 [Betaproteobacteria bacterium]|nr:hypothetical protein [Betaproteobacteria bacterium]
MNTAIADPEYRKQMTVDGINVVGGSAEQFKLFLASERKRWVPLIQKLGIKGQ